MNPAVIQVNDLSFSYNSAGKAAVHQVSFEILPQTVTAILGPNGAGKTTLLHLLLRLKTPLMGSIHLQGRPLNH